MKQCIRTHDLRQPLESKRVNVVSRRFSLTPMVRIRSLYPRQPVPPVDGRFHHTIDLDKGLTQFNSKNVLPDAICELFLQVSFWQTLMCEKILLSFVLKVRVVQCCV